MTRYGANITGSPPYWYARQQELMAIFATKGCATVFFTLSAADNHWEDLFHHMPSGYANTGAGRHKALVENPHIADAYFGERVERFTSAFLDGVLNAEWRWFRHEYQEKGQYPHSRV